MPLVELTINKIPLALRKAHAPVNFTGRTILTHDPWNYVEMWLRRNSKPDALIFWNQAKAFYESTVTLPLTSAPLTAYYCFLNAVKALLISKGVDPVEFHGVAGNPGFSYNKLVNERIEFKGSGILHQLSDYFKDDLNLISYNLKEVLYNLPFVHRAFSLTYASKPELFVALERPHFVWLKGTNKAWFVSAVNKKYVATQTLKRSLDKFETVPKTENQTLDMVRMKKRFSWAGEPATTTSLDLLQKYHCQVRRRVAYIHGPARAWYLKATNYADAIDRCTLPLMYAAMHRFSELARYQPDVLARHFDHKENWLISEFIQLAPRQFIDEIACEITGEDFMLPGYQSDR